LWHICHQLWVYQQWCHGYTQSNIRSLKPGMQQMAKSALKCIIKIKLWNATKLVVIYRKRCILWRDAFLRMKPHFMENVTAVKSWSLVINVWLCVFVYVWFQLCSTETSAAVDQRKWRRFHDTRCNYLYSRYEINH